MGKAKTYEERFQELYTSLYIDVQNGKIGGPSKEETMALEGGLAKMKDHRGFLLNIMQSGQINDFDMKLFDKMWKSMRYICNSNDHVLRYRPLRVLYILTEVYLVSKDSKIISSKSFIHDIHTITESNKPFIMHNRDVIRSLLRLKDRSRYWKMIEDTIDEYRSK